jgi:hypothetical protein
VNADRFQQGRYILGWCPLGGGYNSVDHVFKTAYYNSRFINLTTITQLPHVELDLAKQTSVTLKIPYSSIFPMLEWSSNAALPSAYLGDVFVFPYSALTPGSGGTSCAFTLWASLQNVTIGSASANQSGDMSTREAKAYGVGPISNVFGRISKASAILGPIPIVGEWARNVSWLSNLVAGSAAALGWSKPLNQEAPNRVSRTVNPYAANYDNTSTAKPLGLSSVNSVIPHNGVASTNADEMSFDFIKQQYAYLERFNWSVSDPIQMPVYTKDVTYVQYTAASKGRTYIPYSFIAQNFTKVRGGVRMRFKIVKTEFQRGRLLVTWSPGKSGFTYSYARSEYVFREIVDISTTSEFEVCLPYLLPYPWVDPTTIIGTFKIFVENTLVAPTSVSNSVTILVEMAGLPDVEYANPTAWNAEPYLPSTSQMADAYVATPCIELGPNSTVKIGDLAANTVGEVVSSVRQLVKTIQLMKPIGGTNLAVGPVTTSLKLSAYGWYPVTQAATTTGVLQRDFFNSDSINLWMGCYTYTTGSVRMSFVPIGGSAGMLLAGARPLNGSTSMNNPAGNYDLFAKSFSPLWIEGAAEYQLPVWNATFARSVAAQIYSPTLGSYQTEPYTNTTGLYLSTYDPSFSFSTWRTAGDDFHLSMYVGVPPVVFTTTA